MTCLCYNRIDAEVHRSASRQGTPRTSGTPRTPGTPEVPRAPGGTSSRKSPATPRNSDREDHGEVEREKKEEEEKKLGKRIEEVLFSSSSSKSPQPLIGLPRVYEVLGRYLHR